MNYLSSHREILEKAVSGELPDRVDKNSDVSAEIVRDLVNDGYLEAVDACSMDGLEYLEPKITLLGREYLNSLDNRAREASISGKFSKIGLRALDWGLGILAGLIIAWLSKGFC